MVKIGAKRSVAEIETDEVPAKKQRVGNVDTSTLTQPEPTATFDTHARELCQPWDIEQFFDRVRTFTAMKWFSKPGQVAPVVCAQYGWVCSGTANLISCQVCKQQHKFPVLNTATPSAAQTLIDGFVETIKSTGHLPNCPWRNNPCSESFLHLPHEEALLRVMFQKNMRSYLQDGDGLYTLPRLDPTARQQLITQVPRSDDSKENTCEPTDAMLLSACGWKQRHIVPEASLSGVPASASIFLECQYCNRHISLSPYEFYRTPRIMQDNNDEKKASEHQEDYDSKMTEATTARSSMNVLATTLGNDDAQVLAGKLERMGFDGSGSGRSQWMSVYPSRALQTSPQFITQSDRSFGRTWAISQNSAFWPRGSHLIQRDVQMIESSCQGDGGRRKKRRRSTSSNSDDEENQSKRVRQSVDDEKSFAPPPPQSQTATRLHGQRFRRGKRRKPEPDEKSDETLEDARCGKKLRLSMPEEVSQQPFSNISQRSRKRPLSQEDREQNEEPPPKKRRSAAPAVRTNRFFDPINEHRSPCPYIEMTRFQDESIVGWILAIRAMPREVTFLQSSV